MRILYDSKSAEHKTPFGCVKENEECRMTVHIPESIKTRRAFLILKSDDEFLLQVPMQKTLTKDAYEHYTATFSLYRRGLYFYYFKIETLSGAFSLYKYGAHDTNMEDGRSGSSPASKTGRKSTRFITVRSTTRSFRTGSVKSARSQARGRFRRLRSTKTSQTRRTICPTRTARY